MEQQQGVPPAPAARRDPQGARRGRARGRRRPCRVESAEMPRPRAGGGAEGGRQARAVQRAEPRGGVDPDLARHRPRAAVGRRDRGPNDVEAARAVLDADHHGLDEVKERIVEYLAVRARRAERGLRSAAGAPVRSCCSPVLRESARPRSVSPSRGRWAGSSSGSPSAASATRPRSAATGARTSARCPAASCGPSRRPGR